ncbi:hypothetical protein D3P07_00940 [Paenibacillus sp. 1011MAR3C5]|uniref:hypothetical protein n=1 Tax=Paenibacillus sp. 1011MAR3C5 TaxID=1675787 RepID=UPI000E6D48D0|nr:hypothetical protein [Paenibacillus sp. 1011MAR3C5]RJE90704.1 hypothetical protein D3P07_00940 [Paenibacillus sp. 1011MAR3C5]
MTGLLKFLGWASIVCGIGLGIYYGVQDDPLAEILRDYDDSFRIATAVTWWVSGALSGIVFLALAHILENVEAIRAQMYTPQTGSVARQTERPETGKSRVTLGSVKDFKMRNTD